MPRVLLIDAERRLAAALGKSPVLEGCRFEGAVGEADALRCLRLRSFDAVVTSPRTTITKDLALLGEMRRVRPGVKAILLASRTTPADVIAALRAQAFACFGAPLEIPAIVDMVRRAIDEADWRRGIEVVSARPDWVAVRVNCALLSAERLVTFLAEMRSDVPDAARDELMFAFREILVNAMEHGAGFDPDKVVEVAAVRTERAIVYYVKDPGPGFRPDTLPHAAVSNPAGDPIAHLERRAEQGMRPGGFGLLVARKVVDEMIYSEFANEVLLIKHT